MLNTQMTSELEGRRPQSDSKETQLRKENQLSGKTEEVAKDFYKNRCLRSHLWITAKNGCSDYSLGYNYFSKTRSYLDEEKRGNIEEPVDVHIEGERGHFNSKFINRKPLSLHPLATMETETSGVFPKLKEINTEETKRIVRNFEKIRTERRKIGMEKHFLHRQVDETKGEKSIKLARDQNTLPEVISKRRLLEKEKPHYLPGLNDEVWSAPSSRLSISVLLDKTSTVGRKDEKDAPASHKSMLAWSACVVPVMLGDYPMRKRLPLMTSLKKPGRRVRNNMADTTRGISKPPNYREQSAQSLPRSSLEKPLSSTRLLYPSHHGY